MPISAEEVRSITYERLLERTSLSAAIGEAYFRIGRAVFTSIIQRSEGWYREAMTHAMRSKMLLRRPELHPDLDQRMEEVRFAGLGAELMVNVYEDIVTALMHLESHFLRLPPSTFRRTLTKESITELIGALDAERQKFADYYTANQYSLLPRHRYLDLHRWPDRLLDALAGDEHSDRFALEFRDAMKHLDAIQATVTSGYGHTH